MIILSCSNIAFSFGTDIILSNISFNIQDGEKVGLVGVNGAGKTTLFKILCGVYQPDSGEIYLAKGTRIGYLEQNSGLNSSNTIWEELLLAYAHLIEMEDRIKSLEKDISLESNPNRLNSLMKEYSALTEKFASQGGYEYNSRVRGVLRGLGFPDSQFEQKVQILSGGQKTRLALAKLLLEEPDILFLDEPTNHLDMDAMEWLEDFLKSYKKGVFVISHDRYFLDAVTGKTIELENCVLKTYNCSYSLYIKQKAEEREVQKRHYEAQQKEIARLEAYIEQQRRWNRERNIIAAESRQKAIDRMEKLEKPANQPDKISIRFRSSITSGSDVLFVEGLAKEYPGKSLFSGINFSLKRADMAFILGPNGCGKSTLLKILAGKLQKTGGEFEYGHKIIVGYYDQEQEDLDESRTVLEEVWNYNEKLTNTQVRNTLAAFLFRGEEVFKKVSSLSGGEKSRVALAKLMLSGSNLLLLDEPTNHLDINSREALEEALLTFDGTILAVSHDRYFINKLATRILEFKGNQILDIKGSYSFYIEHRSKQADNSPGREETRLSAAKLDRLENKEEKAKRRRLEKHLNETEGEISMIEARLKVIDTEMTQEGVQSDHIRLTQLIDEQSALKNRLDELYILWEELSHQTNA
jgi:ATP-binding cassette subfamily F protein 3